MSDRLGAPSRSVRARAVEPYTTFLSDISMEPAFATELESTPAASRESDNYPD